MAMSHISTKLPKVNKNEQTHTWLYKSYQYYFRHLGLNSFKIMECIKGADR